MQYQRCVGAVAILAAAVTTACSEAADGPRRVSACSATVAVTVTTTSGTPRFDWTPKCGVSAVDVSSGPSVTLPTSWRIEADSAVITPPVTLHVAPNGARSRGFVELQPNVSYRVDLYILVPGRPADWVGNGGWRQP